MSVNCVCVCVSLHAQVQQSRAVWWVLSWSCLHCEHCCYWSLFNADLCSGFSESSSEFVKQLGPIGLPHDINVQSLFDPTGTGTLLSIAAPPPSSTCTLCSVTLTLCVQVSASLTCSVQLGQKVCVVVRASHCSMWIKPSTQEAHRFVSVPSE